MYRPCFCISFKASTLFTSPPSHAWQACLPAVSTVNCLTAMPQLLTSRAADSTSLDRFRLLACSFCRTLKPLQTARRHATPSTESGMSLCDKSLELGNEKFVQYETRSMRCCTVCMRGVVFFAPKPSLNKFVEQYEIVLASWSVCTAI